MITHSAIRINIVGKLVYGIVIFSMFTRFSSAQSNLGYLSDDGQVVTVGKIPNALQMASFENHLGLVKPGVKVEIYESKRDPVVPATWVKVKILEGEYRGQTGWVLSQTLHELKIREETESTINEGRTAKSTPGMPPLPSTLPMGTNDQTVPEKASHQTVVASALFSSANELDVTNQTVEAGTWLQLLETEEGFTSFQFLKVRVLSGNLKDKVAWIPSHVLKSNVKIISTIIADPNDKKGWPLAEKLARREEIELLPISDFNLQSKNFPDLSQRKEVVLFEHGSELPKYTNAIHSGETPKQLADKFRAAGVSKTNGQVVELIVCTSGQWKMFQGNKYNYAIELAKELDMPVIAYPHYNRVIVNCGMWFSCTGATIKGYRYKYNKSKDQKEKAFFYPPERTKYYPSGQETLLKERLPEVIKRQGT